MYYHFYFRYGSSDTGSYHQNIKKTLEHPILGYSRWQHDDYLNSMSIGIINNIKQRFNQNGSPIAKRDVFNI